MKALILIGLLLCGAKALAYPQMIRHGYNNCMTCHVSPRGGGMMTQYGRALSKEVLSTWGYEGEENWHYGALEKTPDWFNVGGDFRAVQVHSKTEQATIGRFIEMQEQVEVAAYLKNSWVNITASSDTLKESRPWSITQFYLLSQLTDHLNLRVGRFVPRFGINTPEHIFSTRGPLGFGYQAERDTLEVHYIEEKWDFSLAATTGQLQNETRADAFYGQANISFGSNDKLGLSIEKKTVENKETSFGLHALLGFTESWYLVTDSVYRKSEGPGRVESFYHSTKMGYEIEKGIHLIALGDLNKTNLSAENQTQSLYGVGLTLFPRPHFEVQGVLSKQKQLSRSSQEGDYAWLMMHFYL